jgi:hypothetical protein
MVSWSNIGREVARVLRLHARGARLREQLEACERAPCGGALVPRGLMRKLRAYARDTDDGEMLAIFARAREWKG